MSNTRHSVSSQYQKPRSSSKILRYASYFQLSSRCLICDEALCPVFDIIIIIIIIIIIFNIYIAHFL